MIGSLTSNPCNSTCQEFDSARESNSHNSQSEKLSKVKYIVKLLSEITIKATRARQAPTPTQ